MDDHNLVCVNQLMNWGARPVWEYIIWSNDSITPVMSSGGFLMKTPNRLPLFLYGLLWDF